MKAAFLYPSSALAFVLSAVLAPSRASADMVTYTLDPARSTLTLSGTFGGGILQPQPGFPGSLVTSYGGIISAERDRGAHTIQLTGANITAQNNGTSSPIGVEVLQTWEYPPANYAFSAAPPASPPVVGSLGELGFSVAEASPTGEVFPTASLVATFVGGELDSVYPGPPLTIAGESFPIKATILLSPDIATVADASAVETLTIPFNGTFTYISRDGSALNAVLTGDIVASTPIPEPGAGTILGVCAVALLGRRRHPN